MGGDAQHGDLAVMFDGPRVNATYDPMRKQGAILLGNGGDNSIGSQGTFYEGAMTAAGTFPTERHRPTGPGQRCGGPVRRAAAEHVAGIGHRDAARAPDLLAGLLAGHHRDVHQYHRRARTGGGVEHHRAAGWTAVADGGKASATFAGPIAPGASVSATFKVTSGPAAFNGDLVAQRFLDRERPQTQSETVAEKVRNVSPVKINEFRVERGPRQLHQLVHRTLQRRLKRRRYL